MKTNAQNHRIAPAICVYLGGFIIGLTLVSFPASSVFLRQMHNFSNEQYGAIYLPQLVASVVGALAGGTFVRMLSLRAMFAISLLAFSLAEILLALSIHVPTSLALILIMGGTASFGFGFGFGGGPLNAFAAMIFPDRQGAAVTALHMCAGTGLTVAPVAFAFLAGSGHWQAGPVILAIASAVLFLLTLATTFPRPPAESTAGTDIVPPGRTLFFWVCAAAATLYSIVEGTFSNWATVFLTEERGVTAANAALALTCFWASLSLGRLLATALALRVPPVAFLVILPFAMAGALLGLPSIDSITSAYVGFAMAGLACSAFFPMLVAFAANRAPHAISWIASMLTAAMMVGVGIGSYAIGALRGGAPIADLYRQATGVAFACIICVMLTLFLQRRARS